MAKSTFCFFVEVELGWKISFFSFFFLFHSFILLHLGTTTLKSFHTHIHIRSQYLHLFPTSDPAMSTVVENFVDDLRQNASVKDSPGLSELLKSDRHR